MRPHTQLAIGLALAAGLAAPAFAADDTIKIGAPFNVTGALSSLDAPALNGAKLKLKEINDAGGVLGKKLELVIYDTKTDPTVIASVASQLINQDKVPVAFGFTDSDSVLALGPSAEQITDAVTGLSEAAHIAEVASALRPGERSFFRASDVRLRGLLSLLRDDERVQRFAETELRAVLFDESTAVPSNLAVLREYLRLACAVGLATPGTSGAEASHAVAVILDGVPLPGALPRMSRIRSALEWVTGPTAGAHPVQELLH